MKDEKEKEKKDTVISNVIAVIVVIVILGAVVYGVTVIKKPKVEVVKNDYNGFNFYQDGAGFWHTTIRTIQGDQDVPFRLHPSDVDKWSYDPRITERLSAVQKNGGKVVIVFDKSLADPELPDVGAPAIAGVEIGKITANVFGMVTESAFSEEINGTEGIKVFDCSRSGQSTFVFEFRLGEENSSSRVFSENFCGIIRARNLNDTIILADLVAYKLMGIIPS